MGWKESADMNTSILTRSPPPPPFFHLATLGEEEEEEKFDLFFSGWDVERAIQGGSWPGSQGSNKKKKKKWMSIESDK